MKYFSQNFGIIYTFNDIITILCTLVVIIDIFYRYILYTFNIIMCSLQYDISIIICIYVYNTHKRCSYLCERRSVFNLRTGPGRTHTHIHTYDDTCVYNHIK